MTSNSMDFFVVDLRKFVYLGPIYRVLSLRPCELPRKVSNETNNIACSLWIDQKFTAASRGFPATARISCHSLCLRIHTNSFFPSFRCPSNAMTMPCYYAVVTYVMPVIVAAKPGVRCAGSLADMTYWSSNWNEWGGVQAPGCMPL